VNVALSIWFVLVAILGSLTVIAVWSRAATRLRGLAVAGFLLSIPIALTATVACLGRAVPVLPVLSPFPETTITLLGMKFVPNVAIYLLIDNDTPEPRLYRMAWDPKAAMALQAAQEEAQKQNRPLRGKFKLGGGEAEEAHNASSEEGEFDPETPAPDTEIKIIPQETPLTVPNH
jgi:hypothetical protein